jgi:hypothetical protein
VLIRTVPHLHGSGPLKSAKHCPKQELRPDIGHLTRLASFKDSVDFMRDMHLPPLHHCRACLLVFVTPSVAPI